MAEGGYDPTKDNETPGLDNDDDDTTTTTTGLPLEAYRQPITEEFIKARLNALRDMETNLTNSQIPSVENLNTLVPEEVEKIKAAARGFLHARFPTVDFNVLGPIELGTGKYLNRLVVVGPQGDETPIFKVGGKGFMQAFLTTRQLALGPQAEAIRAFGEQMRAAEARVENIEMEDLGLKRKEKGLKDLKDKIAKGEE